MSEDPVTTHGPVGASRLMKFVAFVQIPLILVAIAIYAYVFISVKPLLEHRDALRLEIGSLEKSVKVLREESDRYRVSLQKTSSSSDTPITALVKLRAERRPTGGKLADGRLVYDFSAWIDGPPDVMARIAAIQYEFNHPTFQNPLMRSTNRKDGFRISYIGWGCLTSVIVTFELVEPKGKPPRLDFDMCAGLSQAENDVPPRRAR